MATSQHPFDFFKTPSMPKAELYSRSGPESGVRPRRSYRGLWVALENCRYDGETGKPVAGTVVDCDEQFGDLCARMKSGGRCSCAIVYCDDNFCLESDDITFR